MILALTCRECENVHCIYSKGYIPEGSKEGCTRLVSQDVNAKYMFYMFEKWPNMLNAGYSLEHISAAYKEIIDFLYDEIYTAPIGQKIPKSGRIKLT